jgi:hypothetical protein
MAGLAVAARRWLDAAAGRVPVVIGAAAGMVAISGGLVLLTSHPATTAAKCHGSNCLHPVSMAPGSLVPAILPSLPQPAPTLSSRAPTRPAVAVATTPVTTIATPRPSVAGAATSPSTTATSPEPTPGSWISIQATTPCCTSFYIRHDDHDNALVITQITSASSVTTKADATWLVRTGLADSSCVSFESANQSGRYLRHFDFELYLEPNDGGSQFAEDATFCPRPGNSGQGYSFQSVNYPDQYIRHYDYVVHIASDGGSNPWDTPTWWPDDTTWLVDRPWGTSSSPGSSGYPGSPGCGQPCH